MRVLFLRRQRTGGLAALTNAYAEALDEFDVEAVIDDAESWIPNETGWSVDRQVSKAVKRAAQGFNMVHAFGYRAAWACSEAFYVRQPWIYTAYDQPKTTNGQLIDRLNAARRGVASSRAVLTELSEADTLGLEVISPGVRALPPAGDLLTERRRLGIPEEAFVVLACGRAVAERGFDQLAEAIPAIRESREGVHFIFGLQGEVGFETHGAQMIGTQPSLHPWISAADLVVVPSRRQGFSMLAAEAMSLGRPVLMRRAGGLSEMAVDGLSAFYFEENDNLAEKILRIADAPLARESMGNAAKIRAEERFDIRESARRLKNLYEDLLRR